MRIIKPGDQDKRPRRVQKMIFSCNVCGCEFECFPGDSEVYKVQPIPTASISSLEFETELAFFAAKCPNCTKECRGELVFDR